MISNLLNNIFWFVEEIYKGMKIKISKKGIQLNKSTHNVRF